MPKGPQWPAYAFSLALLVFAVAIIVGASTGTQVELSWFRDWYVRLSPETKDIVKASLGPTVAILLFVLTQIVQIFIAQSDKRNEIRLIVSGICREIEHNLADQARLSTGLEETIDGIKKSLRADDAASTSSNKVPTYRPLLGITDATQFYDSVASASPVMEPKVLACVSAYYRCVADERVIVKAIENYAFLYVTVESRCEMVDELYRAFNEAQTTGGAAVASIRSNYPERWFSA